MGVRHIAYIRVHGMVEQQQQTAHEGTHMKPHLKLENWSIGRVWHCAYMRWHAYGDTPRIAYEKLMLRLELAGAIQ